MSGGSINQSNKLLKVLCLHGCVQNKEIFKQKIGSLRKALSKVAELVFVESPHTITTYNTDQQDVRSWWFTAEDGTYVSREASNVDPGFKQSVTELESFVLREGPFDGLLGFSQGATLAALICSMIQRGEFSGSFKFVILVAGFKSKCAPHQEYYDKELTISSLHVIGDTDQVISKERSEELVSLFREARVLRHGGGHYVPATKETKQTYIDFLASFIT